MIGNLFKVCFRCMADSGFNVLVERLVDVRTKVGMPQSSLARELDVSVQHLSRFEKRQVRSSNILVDYMLFLRGMGVPSEFLLCGEGECDLEAVSVNVRKLLDERKRTRREVGNVDEDFLF